MYCVKIVLPLQESIDGGFYFPSVYMRIEIAPINFKK